MSSSTRVPSPVRSTEPWYTKSLRSVDRNVFLSVLRTCHRKSTASSTAIREGPWAPNQPQKDYDAVVKAWRTEKGRFPCELPGLRPEDRASRIAFWSMVEDILNRTPIELVDHIQVVLACSTAMQQLVLRELPTVYTTKEANAIDLEAHEEVLYEHTRGQAGGDDVRSWPGNLGGVRSLVGHTFTYRSIQYRVHACYVASDGDDPVYELHYADDKEKLVKLRELQELLGDVLDI